MLRLPEAPGVAAVAGCLVLALGGCASLPGLGRSKVETGLEVLEKTGFKELQGKRVGLITNHTGMDRRGRTTVEVLAKAKGVRLEALFSPEHGFTGTNEENAVSSSTLRLGGRDIPIVSLYSGGISGMRPRPEDLKNLDALVFDIQDIGTRAYTYLATMGMAMEEVAKAGLKFIVLDRPNPINGVTMEGPVLDDLSLRQVTATAYFPEPVRHGLTPGEIARLYAAELGYGKLTVVKMRGWTRDQWFDETGLPWIPPSPNMPDLEAAALYPGISIFESSNLAVGRGTPLPFRWIGAPWMKGEEVVRRLNEAGLEGISFSAQDYTPSKSVFQGELCHGVRMKVTDREKVRPLKVFLRLNDAVMSLHPQEMQWRWDEAKRMVGTDKFREMIERKASLAELDALFDQGARDFAELRQPHLLY
ncbi:MAG: DUF1343 domain-containing protein [Elusimicrobia bacterium]|nr:DUF1343 domain-containing protein [Elusimicrobiota bacterium]